MMEMKIHPKSDVIARGNYGEDVEVRTMEVRAAEGGDLTVEGYAAVFETETDLGYFREKISRGAFDDVMNDDVRLLLNHDGAPLARTTNGTLELSTDDTGLHYRAVLSDTQAGRDLYKMIQRGDITQSSFAFTIREQSWSEDKAVRSVDKVGSLLDVSPVTYPAYPQASVMARSNYAAQASAPKPDEAAPEAAPAAAEAAAPDVREAGKTEISESRNLPQNSNPENMTIRQLQDERARAFAEFEGLVSKADNEGRSFTDAEQQRYDFLRTEVARLDDKIQRQKDLDAMSARANGWGAEPSRAEAREVSKVSNKFSMGRAFAQAVAGRPLEGAEAEFQQEARAEASAYGVSLAGDISIPEKVLRHAKHFRAGSADNFQAGSGDGSGFVPTNVPGFIEGLYAPSVLEQAGATIIPGATTNLKFPRTSVKPVPSTGTNTGAAVKNEYDGVDEGLAFQASGMELDELNMSPKQAGFYTDHSKLLLLQGGDGVANFITQELYRGMMNRMDQAALETFAAATINEVSSGDTALNAALVNAMISRVMGQHADHENGTFILSPNAWNLAQSEVLVSAVSALYNGNSINGRRAIATANLADGLLADAATTGGQILFGNFTQGTILAYFGGIDIEFDRSTLSTKAAVRVVMHRYFDFAIRQAGAICKANALT